ncbi:MAG: hypothetical protein LBH42_07400 [Treponema sp.]|nr:hypothetical protein [Treponema sp.]
MTTTFFGAGGLATGVLGKDWELPVRYRGQAVTGDGGVVVDVIGNP